MAKALWARTGRSHLRTEKAGLGGTIAKWMGERNRQAGRGEYRCGEVQIAVRFVCNTGEAAEIGQSTKYE